MGDDVLFAPLHVSEQFVDETTKKDTRKANAILVTVIVILTLMAIITFKHRIYIMHSKSNYETDEK